MDAPPSSSASARQHHHSHGSASTPAVIVSESQTTLSAPLDHGHGHGHGHHHSSGSIRSTSSGSTRTSTASHSQGHSQSHNHNHNHNHHHSSNFPVAHSGAVPTVSALENEEDDWVVINAVQDATFANVMQERFQHKYEETTIRAPKSVTIGAKSSPGPTPKSSEAHMTPTTSVTISIQSDVSYADQKDHSSSVSEDASTSSTGNMVSDHSMALSRRFTSVGKDGQDDGYADKVYPRPSVLLHPSRFGKMRYYTLALFIIANLVPAAALVGFYGFIPLRAVDGTFTDKLVWILFVNPFTFTVFSYLGCIIFCAALDDSVPWRPFRTYVRILIACWIVETGFFLIFYGLFDSWHAMGLVSIFLSILTTLIGLHLSRNLILPDSPGIFAHRFYIFRKVSITIFIFVGILTLYTIAFKSGSSGVQSLLSILIVFVAFGFKKYLLSLTDAYPIEISMLIAGLWIEHLEDVFVVIAYPQVNTSLIPFFLLAFSKFIQNAAYLLFLTDRWFRFRVWIKAFLKGCFTCRGTDPNAKPIEMDDFEDRGHSNVKQGYHRRQVQFFMWKILSQLNGNIVFLTMSPALRYGPNEIFYPYSQATTTGQNVTVLDEQQYENALAFCGVMFFMVFFAGVAGFFIVRRRFPNIFSDLQTLYSHVLLGPAYFVFILAIIFSNQLLAIAILQAQNRIWFWEYKVSP